ncbi:MAG: hypothetical protein SFY68_15775 [Candidatus Sumerlaeia bacterium]|nr:hypothetical protein [Candidatus Sumerlaeia bacterium]
MKTNTLLTGALALACTLTPFSALHSDQLEWLESADAMRAIHTLQHMQREAESLGEKLYVIEYCSECSGDIAIIYEVRDTLALPEGEEGNLQGVHVLARPVAESNRTLAGGEFEGEVEYTCLSSYSRGWKLLSPDLAYFYVPVGPEFDTATHKGFIAMGLLQELECHVSEPILEVPHQIFQEPCMVVQKSEDNSSLSPINETPVPSAWEQLQSLRLELDTCKSTTSVEDNLTTGTQVNISH